MLWDETYLAATGSWIPPTVDITDAITRGDAEPAVRDLIGFRTIAVAGSESALDMAERAAMRAMSRSRHQGTEISKVIHVSIAEQQHLAPAMRIQRALGVPDGCGFELRSASSGDLAALTVAASHLACDPTSTAVLVTGADTFPKPEWNRWRDAPGMVFGDAAAAVLVSRRGGLARLLATTSGSAAELEAYGRLLTTPSDDHAETHRTSTRGFSAVADTLIPKTGHVVSTAMTEAGVSHADYVAITGLGKHIIDTLLRPSLGIDSSHTSWPVSRNIGHTCVDTILGLDHAVRSGALHPGEHVLMISIGVGFTVYCAVIEITEHQLIRPA